MAKDECDIIELWIKYYGYIFGLNNLYIIDNYSTDGTYEICKKYIDKGIHLTRHNNYLKKGELMTNIKNTSKPYDFFFPVDVDEFLVLYKNENLEDINSIYPYFKYLKSKHNNTLFKTDYIDPIKTTEDTTLKQFTHGSILNYGSMAKTFLKNTKSIDAINIDIGNHINTNDYIKTSLYLIHFSNRSDEQFKKRVRNNISGLGYQFNIQYLNKLINRKGIIGYHHVQSAIDIIKNTTKDFGPVLKKPKDIDISLFLDNLFSL